MIKVVITCILASVLPTAVVHAQTLGDECSNPYTAGLGPNTFTTSTATPSFPEPDGTMCSTTSLNWSASRDVWFEFTPTTSGSYTFTTCDVASYDTSMVLYENTCSNQIACNGDSTGLPGCQSFYSTIQSNLVANIPYYVRIGGFAGATGTGTLTITSNIGPGTIWYVNQNNPNPGSGISWSTAFHDVQDALDVASGSDQIWIAQGVYLPSDLGGTSNSREASYRLIDNVELYGGFFGNEGNLFDRQPNVFRVYLSGDLNGDDDSFGDNSENAYHVVTADGAITSGPIIDGLFIQSGNADNAGNNSYGGGFLVENYLPTSVDFPFIRACHFFLNSAKFGGAIGIPDTDAGASIYRVFFSSNEGTTSGGAIFSRSNFLHIDNCLIVGNTAVTAGSIYNDSGALEIFSSTIVQNTAGFVGGLFSNNGNVVSSNTIYWENTDYYGNNEQIYLNSASWNGNYNCIQNFNSTLGGTGNISLNPLFLNELGIDGVPASGDENFMLFQQSPCIDAGDSTAVFHAFDIAGSIRILDDPYMPDTGNNPTGGPIVDMGAYEHVVGSNNVSIWSGATGNLFGDPGNWLPFGTPDIITTTLFNIDATPNILESRNIDRLVVVKGSAQFFLQGISLSFTSQTEPLRVGGTNNGASATFRGSGFVTAEAPIKFRGSNISFLDNLTLLAPSCLIENETMLNFDGTLGCALTNDGSTIEIAGNNYGTFFIKGDLVQQGASTNPKNLTSSMKFDIGGLNPMFIDKCVIFGNADLNTSIDLRWNPPYTPIPGSTFDLMTVGSSTGKPLLVYSSGLPSNLSVRWTTPIGLRVAQEVLVETTGPILFAAGNALPLSTTPNDMVVADFDGINGPDIAMTVTSPIGGPGTVVILLNNGMTGNTWLGFTERPAITVGIEPLDIAVGDLNGDGTANDLVIANYSDDTISILSNDNLGVFTKTDIGTVSSGPKFIAIGDYVEEISMVRNDIVVACDSFKAVVFKNTSAFRSQAVSFIFNNTINIPLPLDIDPGDVNTDKDLDFVLLDGASEEILVLHGTGTGHTPLGVVTGNPLPTSSMPTELEFADIDGDTLSDDVITVNEGDHSLSVLIGSGTELGSASTFAVGTSPTSLTVFDFDNDSDDDLLISVIGAISGSRELTILRNDTISPDTVVLSAGDSFGSGTEPTMLEHGDFDGDGLEDVASIIDLTPLQFAVSPAMSIFFNTTEVVVLCIGDADGDGSVAVGDILAIVGSWGTADETLDLDGSGFVDVGDILIVVGNWGPC